MARLILCLAIVISAAASTHAATRTWTDDTGRFKVDAELVSVSDGKVKLKRADGRVVELPVARLSAADQKFLKSAEAAAKTPGEAALAKFNGVWKISEFYSDGVDVLGKQIFHIQITGHTILQGDIEDDEFISDRRKHSFAIDATTTPKEIDVTHGGTRLGTYTIARDTITMCALVKDGHKLRVKTAPTKPKKGDGLLFMVLTRVKPREILPEERPTIAEVKSYDAAITKPLWSKFDAARDLTFHSPWRKAGNWAVIDQRLALHKIIEKCPNSLDEVRARLELSRRLLNWSPHSARYQILMAQRQLRGLILKGNASSELTRTVAEAALHPTQPGRARGVVSGRSVYRDDAIAYLEERWNAGESDAPLAGWFRASLTVNHSNHDVRDRQTLVQIKRYQEVAAKYSKSKWGQAAAYDALRKQYSTAYAKQHGSVYKSEKQFALARIDFAKKHPASPIAAIAMASAADDYFQSERLSGPNEKDLQRITKGFEICAAMAKKFPDGVDLGWYPHAGRVPTAPHLSWKKPFDPNTEELEKLIKQFFAWEPLVDSGFVFLALSEAKGLDHNGESRAKYTAFIDQFWTDVERIATKNKKAAVAARHAYTLSPSYMGGVPPKLFESAINRVLMQYPDSPYAASVLDAMARDAWRAKNKDEAIELWQRLLKRYPKHPLCRPVALELAYYQHADGDPKKWRRALTQLQERFGNDPFLDVLCPYLRAKSFRQENRHVDAWREMQLAAPHRRAVFPSEGVGMYSYVEGRHAKYVRGRSPFDACLADAFEVGILPHLNAIGPLAKYEGRDIQFLADLGKTDAELLLGRLAFVKQFADSPQIPSLLFQVGLQYERMKKFDEARAAYAKIESAGKPRAEQQLVASLARLRLDYEQLGSVPKKLTAKQAADEVRRLLAQYIKQSIAEVQTSAAQQSAVEVYRDVTSQGAEEQLRSLAFYEKRLAEMTKPDSEERVFAKEYQAELKYKREAWNKSVRGQFEKLIAERKADQWTFISPSKKLWLETWTGEERAGELRIDLPNTPRVAILPKNLHLALGIQHDDKTTTLSKFAKDVVPLVLVTDKAGLPVSTTLFTRYRKIQFRDEKQTKAHLHQPSRSDTDFGIRQWKKDGDRWVRGK
ncbi:MAG: hypothetical protein IID44_07120 [Planctomycetes bacterium]|nr:hypothetical protein [Planctomycetota bacterium]